MENPLAVCGASKAECQAIQRKRKNRIAKNLRRKTVSKYQAFRLWQEQKEFR